MRYERSDGFIRNRVLDKPQDDYRKLVAGIRLRAILSDDAEFNFDLDVADRKGHSPGPGLLEKNGRKYEVFFSDQETDKRRTAGGSARLDWSLGFARLVAILGGRRTTENQFTDLDQGPARGNNQFFRVEQKHQSGEVRLESNSASRLTWIAGVYAFKEKRDFDQIITAGQNGPGLTIFYGITADQYYNTDRKGYAFFGQGTYKLGKLDVTGGVRWDHENARIDSIVNFAIPAFGLTFTQPFANEADFSAFTFTGSAVFHLASNATLYATVARGFKAGGFQDFGAAAPEFAPFDNEISDNYEAGVKASFGRMGYVSASIWRTNITGQQLRTRVLIPFPRNVVVNAGKSHTQGIEFEGMVRPFRQFSLSGSLAYTPEAKFDSLDPASFSASDISTLAGSRFPFVPKLTISGTAEYAYMLQNDAQIVARGTLRHISSYDTNLRTIATGGLTLPVAAYQVADAQISYETHGLRAGIFAKNLLNSYIPVVRTLGTLLSNDVITRVNQPRRVGLFVTVNW